MCVQIQAHILQKRPYSGCRYAIYMFIMFSIDVSAINANYDCVT